MRTIFISHSSDTGPQARAFLQRLPQALREHGLDPFLDVINLRQGYEWAPVLHRKLAECAGAVLVLGPGAAAKPWVRKEATILSWRQALLGYRGRPLPLVVVPLDGLTRAELDRDLPALHLGAIHQQRVGSDDVDAAVAAADDVAAYFPEGEDLDDPMQQWTREVGAWLEGVGPYFLGQLGDLLDVPYDDVDPENHRRMLADALLHAVDVDVVEDALEIVVRSASARADRVLEAALPVAISAASAQVLLPTLQQDAPTRLVAVNTYSFVLGEFFARRATCCDGGVLVVVRTPTHTSGDPDTLYAEILTAIGERVGARPPESFRLDDLQHVRKKLVVLLQQAGPDQQGLPGLVLEPVLARLRRDVPTCTFVVLAGPRRDDDQLLVEEEFWAEPPLDEHRLRGWELTANRLRDELKERVA